MIEGNSIEISILRKYQMKSRLNKILEHSFYLVIFLLPWQTRYFIFLNKVNGSLWEYGSFSLYAFDFVIIFSIILYLCVNSANLFKTAFNKVWYFFALFELSIFVSIFYTVDINLSLYWYFSFLLGLILFFLVSKSFYSRIKMLNVFLISSFLQALIGIWQFLSQASFASKYLGIAFHPAYLLGTSVMEFGEGRWTRAYGGLPHPNIFGTLMFISIVLLLFILSNFQLNKNRKVVYNFFLFVFLFSLLISFSRAIYLSLLIMSITLLFIKRKIDIPRSTLLILFVTCFTFFIIYHDFIVSRMSLNNRIESNSIEERISMNEIAINLIKEKPFFGWGINSYTAVLKNNNNNLAGYSLQPVHNSFLLVLSELGVLGLISFLLIYFYLLYNSIVQNKKFSILMLFSILPVLFLDHWMLSLHLGLLLLFFIFAFSRIELEFLPKKI